MQPAPNTPPAPNAPPKKKTSPWLFVAIGCGGLLLLGGLFIGGIVLFALKKADELQEDMANPVVRTEKVKKALGAQTLPDGYHALMTLSIPLIIDTAIMSTAEPGAGSAAKDSARMFVYVRLRSATSSDVKDLRDYLEGRTDDHTVLTRSNFKIRTEEIVGRGALDLDGGRRLLYLGQRGELQLSNTSDNHGPGLNSLVLFECPGKSGVRIGIWTAPDATPEVPLAQMELEGTPVDPAAIRSFMSHFNPCQVE